MKRINKMQDGTPSFSYSSWSSSSNPATRSDGVWECWSSELTNGRAGVRPYRVFCGLGLELFARPVITNETVLPKAAVTAGTNTQIESERGQRGSPRRAATISLERSVVSKQ